jgi:hypothetical protein
MDQLMASGELDSHAIRHQDSEARKKLDQEISLVESENHRFLCQKKTLTDWRRRWYDDLLEVFRVRRNLDPESWTARLHQWREEEHGTQTGKDRR